MTRKLQGRRVLLVEDSPYVRDALTRLRESGAVVLAVGGPGAAPGRRGPGGLCTTDGISRNDGWQ